MINKETAIQNTNISHPKPYTVKDSLIRVRTEKCDNISQYVSLIPLAPKELRDRGVFVL